MILYILLISKPQCGSFKNPLFKKNKTMGLKSSNLQPLWSPFNRWFQDTWDRQMPWDLCFPSHPAVPARRPTSLALRQDLRTAVFLAQELRKDEKNDEWRVLILKMCKLSKVIKTMWPTTQSSSIFVFMVQVIRLFSLDSPFPPAGFDVPARAVGNKLAAELSLDINLSDQQDCYMFSKGFQYVNFSFSTVPGRGGQKKPYSPNINKL